MIRIAPAMLGLREDTRDTAGILEGYIVLGNNKGDYEKGLALTCSAWAPANRNTGYASATSSGPTSLYPYFVQPSIQEAFYNVVYSELTV